MAIDTLSILRVNPMLWNCNEKLYTVYGIKGNAYEEIIRNLKGEIRSRKVYCDNIPTHLFSKKNLANYRLAFL